MRTYAYFSLGLAHRRVGSYAEAVTVLERARTIVQESHTGLEYEPPIASFLASAYVDSGDTGRALRSAEEAVTLVRRRRLRHLEPWAHFAIGYVLLRARGLESRNAIEAALGDALRSSRKRGLRFWEPLICLDGACQ